ncbi:MAG TPA: DUF370 domain-containing protein [Firmicutes bacterium]|nr:DUF370 domain-containing protein [Bacillota bacterium]
MYLHLGQDVVVRTEEIIGIFDMDNATVSRASKRYLAMAEKAGRVVNITGELPKTFVVCGDREGKITVYISQISSATLRKRTTFIDDIANIP